LKAGQQKPEGGAATSRAPTPDEGKFPYAAVGPAHRMAPPWHGTLNRGRQLRWTHPEGRVLKGVFQCRRIGPVFERSARLITVVGITVGRRLGAGAQALVSR
jgi:hypothetical protein